MNTDKFEDASRTSERRDQLFRVALLSFILLTVAHLAVAQRFDLPSLVGDRSGAIFDLWSLQHFSSGILFGAILVSGKLVRCRTWKDHAFCAFLFALGWEAVELAMEAGLTGRAVANWKGGFEHWGNRLLGDPLTVTVGALLARSFPYAWKIVLLPVVAWFLLNVLSPNSMSIQNLLFG